MTSGNMPWSCEPFLLRPAGKDYLWGGTRLNDEFAKDIPLSPLAETWECSTHPDGPSTVSGGPFDGQTLAGVLARHPEFLGTRHPDGQLPLLIKFIDARQDLSVQVHPGDDFARLHENGQRGKSELWYVLDAGKDARLAYGLNRDCTREELRQAVETGALPRYLQYVPIQRGDLFFVKAGTIHAIGAGALLAEIQENSNLTYRLYDYDRVDKQGNRRPLHLEKALQVADLRHSAAPRQPLRLLHYRQGMASELLARCQYFEVHRLLLNTERRQKVFYRADALSFRVLLCVGGCGSIRYEGGEILFYKGDCVFVPAGSPTLTLNGQAQFLDVRS